MSEGRFSFRIRERGCEVELEDESSGLVIKVMLNPNDTLRLLSGLSCTPCEVEWPKRLDLIGKELETEWVNVPKTNLEVWDKYSIHSQEDKTKEINHYLEKEGFFFNGWEVKDYGFKSKQNTQGFHKVVLRRWVNKEDSQC